MNTNVIPLQQRYYKILYNSSETAAAKGLVESFKCGGALC